MASPDVLDPTQHDFMGIGSHCQHQGCSQLDFLPFQCTLCAGTYCLEHRTPTAHACKHADKGNVSTVICPLCAKAIKLQGAEDANEAFEKHSRSGQCDPSNYRAVHAKPKCPATGCREKLAASNTYRCKDCNKDVCMKHRFAADHQCTGRQGPSNSWPNMLSSAPWSHNSSVDTRKKPSARQGVNRKADRSSAAPQSGTSAGDARSATAAKWTEWWKRFGK